MTIHNLPAVKASLPIQPYRGDPYLDWITASSGQRILTSAVEIKAIRAKHPDRALTIVNDMSCDLLAFATSGGAKAVLSTETSESIFERVFQTPARRHDDEYGGSFVQNVLFAAYDYEFRGKAFLVYVASCVDGYFQMKMNYILSGPGSKKMETEGDKDADALVAAATMWGIESHEEMWVFNGGMWIKDKELFKAVQKSSWDNVILAKEKKKALIDDVEGFFSGEASYKEFAVPWKRGLIFYGPPGNGKTISIKALMNSLGKRKDPTVEMLYVKSFNSFMGPEYGINAIFTKARQMAPCILVFEDIDSLVTIPVRSYFLNAVDGLEPNHGILMIGSTNHLERLDPGIAKRPSRFDRKYLFALPTRDERVQYCEYWRNKLKDNKKIEFPKLLCSMIADITGDFSFAYMKEAFVAALLVIVVSRGEDENVVAWSGDSERKEAEKTLLWKEVQKQVKILREEMDNSM